MAWGYGLKTDKDAQGRIVVTNIDNDETLTLRGVDFGKGAKRFTASVADVKPFSTIEIHLDSADGPLVGRLTPEATGSDFRSYSCKVKGAKGVHDLVFRFRGLGRDLMKWDWWKFEK